MNPSLRVSSSLRAKQSNPRSWVSMPCWDCFFAMLIAMTLSCSTLQNLKKSNTSDEASLKTNLEASQTGASSLTRVSDSFVLQKDLADKVYTIRFWPKGKFSFSMQKGFEGEAEKVEVNAWLKEGNYKMAQQQTGEKLDSNWTNTAVQKQEQKLLKKSGTVEKSVSWKWIIGAFGTLIIILIGIYIKIKIKKLWQL